MGEHPDISVTALRRLAQGLLYDRHGAEDVVQEAWLAALDARPPTARLGAWLSEAVKRLALNRRRAESRRRTREERAARCEALPGADEHAARIEILRSLLDALERLDEPYRSAVMLRYLEDLPPREIARRLALPVNTARTHVRRGLEGLRRDLDGERGRSREEFLAALVPFAGSVPWTMALGLPADSWLASNWNGLLLVKKKILLAVVVALVFGIPLLVARSWKSAPSASAKADLIAIPESTPSSTAPSELATLAIADEQTSQREPAALPRTMDGTWVVRGHAFRHRGESFPGLELVGRVYAGPQHEGRPILEQRFHTDDAGDFAWPIEPPLELVTVLVEPEAEGCLERETYDVFLPGDPAPERWTVSALPLDCIVRGTVRDPEYHPVAGARLRERDRVEEQETSTDESGRYALRIASDSERRLRVCAAGFAQQSFTIDASSPGEVEAPDVILGPELRIRGRVVGEDGQPIAGAVVEPSHPFFLVSTTTGADGAFELGTLDLEASYLALEAHKEGYVATSKRIDREERTSPVELRLARGVRVAGRVVGPDGAPVFGAWVSVGYTPWSDVEAYSDRAGGFTIEHVPAGEQTVWAWRTGLAQKRLDVAIPSDTEVFALDLELEDDHFVGGLVLDQNGAPMPWVFVYADDPEAGGGADKVEGFQVHTGADGRFLIDGLPEVAITVGALAEGRARVEQQISALDRDDLVLRMSPSAGFAGSVVDAASGAPIRAFVVRVGFPPPALQDQAVAGYPAVRSRGVAFNDPEGRWHLEDDFEPDQVAAITIEAAGYAPATTDVVRTALAPDPAAFVVRLAGGTLVRGRVVEKASGAPVAGARVRRCTARVPFEALDHTDEPVAEATTDAAGRFELRNVPTGSMSLAVQHPSWTLASDGPFEVSGSTVVERWIELGAGASVNGRLLDASGRGLAGETVSISCLEGVERTREHQATTGADGSYALAGLSPGQYHLRWVRLKREIRLYDLVQLVTLAESEALTLDLQPRGRATVTGTLEYDGVLPEVASVILLPRSQPRPDGTHPHWAESVRGVFAENGRFTAPDLEPGTYTFSVHLAAGQSGFAMGSTVVEVPAAGSVDAHIRIERRR